ncbi:MAG TPA: ATP-binding protein [Woeseiaceae bacterium]|nr:ATP-binding protein [Woeseiaceae bacterium]
MQTGEAEARETPMSIRSLALVTTSILGVLTLLVIVSLVWGSSQLQQSISTAVRDSRSQAIADELQLSFLTYQRLSNLHVLTGEADLAETRAAIRREMDVLLARAQDYVGSPGEQQLLDDVAALLTEYWQVRSQLEAGGPELEEIVAGTVPVLNDTIAKLELLTDLNDAQVRAAHTEALRLNRLSNVIGSGAGILLALMLIGGVFGVRRYLLRPMLDLHQTVSRLREGDADARSGEFGPAELKELSRGFNAMAHSLARQREERLALLAGIAHDLKNPLAGMKWGIYALEQEQSDAHRRFTCARLNRQVDLLARMVNDLLDTTRIEAGKLEMQQQDFDVRDVAEEIIRLYEPTSPDHDIVLEQPDEPVIVHGDPLRIEQILSNLVSNAIKFSPGGGSIKLTTRAESDVITLCVSDQGIGIASNEVADLFTPFQRRRSDIAPGAGLGLSVVHRIVAAHDGRIDVDSEPGVGSTFYVRLPAGSRATTAARTTRAALT